MHEVLISTWTKNKNKKRTRPLTMMACSPGRRPASRARRRLAVRNAVRACGSDRSFIPSVMNTCVASCVSKSLSARFNTSGESSPRSLVDPIYAKKDDTLPPGEPVEGLCRNVMRDCDPFLYARISTKARRHRLLTETNVTAS
jgi:hypothetical protein